MVAVEPPAAVAGTEGGLLADAADEVTPAEPAAGGAAAALGDEAAVPVPVADVTGAAEDAAALVGDPLEQPAMSKPSATTMAPATGSFISILPGCVRDAHALCGHLGTSAKPSRGPVGDCITFRA